MDLLDKTMDKIYEGHEDAGAADDGIHGIDTDLHSSPLGPYDLENFRSSKNRSSENSRIVPSDRLHDIDMNIVIGFNSFYMNGSKEDPLNTADLNAYLEYFMVSNTRDYVDISKTDRSDDMQEAFIAWVSQNRHSFDASLLSNDFAGYFEKKGEMFQKIISNRDPLLKDVDDHVSWINLFLNNFRKINADLCSSNSVNLSLNLTYTNIVEYIRQNRDTLIQPDFMIGILKDNAAKINSPDVLHSFLSLTGRLGLTSQYKEDIVEILELISGNYGNDKFYRNLDRHISYFQKTYEFLGGKNELFPVKEESGPEFLRLDTPGTVS
ncbi:MAG: hypothetical protein U9O53_03185 [archaeon]|nr:hypothetical protein [archaeon]